MQQNFGIEIPRSPTIVMGSFPSRNIGQLLHEEIVRLIVLEGFVSEGSEPITDPHLVNIQPIVYADPTWEELLDGRVAALMKDLWFWIIGVAILVTLTGFHVTSHGDGFFAPVANVYLPLEDGHATEEHCFEGTVRFSCERSRTGYAVRGGTLRARVIAVVDQGIVNGIHRALATVQIHFDIDGRYDGWGVTRFDRPILYGFATGARSVGEGSRRHVEAQDDMVLLEALQPPEPYDSCTSRYAPTLIGSCSTDYRHDLCRFRATVPITGDTNYLQIHLRERFR